MLTDCEKCWQATCVCGHQYRDWSLQDLENLRGVLDAAIERRRALGPVDPAAGRHSGRKLSAADFERTIPVRRPTD